MDILRKFAVQPQSRPASSTKEYADSSLNHISLEYSYAELQQATRNFDEGMKLGSGSYGGVFRGVLKDGTQVAIKVLDIPEEAGFEEEVKVLSKFRHPHLVILMGFGRRDNQRFLVYEHLAGGDVHKRLQRSCVEGLPFIWRERLSIALDSACGLSHLHNSSPKVFHRDIKTPNILLDKNGTAKMADFGLACLSHSSAYKVKQASGTVGYACPLYIQRGVVTEGSEVYSFGMVLLELLTASTPAYMGPKLSNGESQIQYLAHHINGDLRVALSLVDAKAHWPPSEARAVAELALSCIADSEQQRPTFSEIVRTLRVLYEATNTPPIAPAGMVLPITLALSGPPPKPVPLVQHCPGRAPLLARGVAPSNNQQPYVERRFFSPSPLRKAAVHCQPGFPVLPNDRCVSPFKQAPRAHSPQPRHSAEASAPAGHLRQPCQHENSYAPAMAKPLPVKPAFPAAVAAATPQTAVAKVGQLLFSLECVFAEGLDVNAIPWESRVLSHHAEEKFFRGGDAAAESQRLLVGRAFQTKMFDMLIPCQTARSVISREHFDITAQSVQPRRGGCVGMADSRSKHFQLSNLSSNGTSVNDNQLQRKGDFTPIQDGDVITLSRSVVGACGPYQAKIIQFRFTISPSLVPHAEREPHHQNAQLVERLPSGMSSSSSIPTAPPRADELAEMQIITRDNDAVFMLEVCGPGVNDQLPIDQRCMAYKPPDADPANPQLYTSLTLGRAYQLEFWQSVLNKDAFGTLSRQHLEIQTWHSMVRQQFSFLVRNLSDVNPVHVRNGPKETSEDHPVTLAKGEQQHLLNGDEIVLNLNQEHTFWLIFRDMTASTRIPR